MKTLLTLALLVPLKLLAGPATDAAVKEVRTVQSIYDQCTNNTAGAGCFNLSMLREICARLKLARSLAAVDNNKEFYQTLDLNVKQRCSQD